ncbi:MAG: outer membrane protein assembly factor BamD [Alphaproteobacteria bacterium]|nr:outer membrane protein assembly factor BamD [Alphaproteobacteria bacterium]
MIKKYVILGMILTLVGCATPKPDPEKTSPEELYNYSADLLINQRKYTKAIEAFDDIDRYYPYSKWALKGQIMMAFTHYIKKEYDEAESVLERFIQLYPGNQYAPYAYYLKAMCSYAQIVDPTRSQYKTQMALDALKDVAVRFPNTNYGKEASKKIALTYEYLAAEQVKIGEYYQKDNNYAAALNRYIEVVKMYQNTRYTIEALYRMAEVYLILGLDEEAKKAISVLGYNYPTSIWYERAFKLYEKHTASK